MNIEPCIASVLLVGTYDWTGASMIATIAANEGGARLPHEIRALSLRVIQHLLDQGLVEVGELNSKGDVFVPWAVSTNDALQRIEAEWPPDVGKRAFWTDTWWLNLTQLGEARARTIESQATDEAT